MAPPLRAPIQLPDYSARIDPNYYSYSLGPPGAAVTPVGAETADPDVATASVPKTQSVDFEAPEQQQQQQQQQEEGGEEDGGQQQQGEEDAQPDNNTTEPEGKDGAQATSLTLEAISAGKTSATPHTASKAVLDVPEGLPVMPAGGAAKPAVGEGNPYAADFVDAPPPTGPEATLPAAGAGAGAAAAASLVQPSQMHPFASSTQEELRGPPDSLAKTSLRSHPASTAFHTSYREELQGPTAPLLAPPSKDRSSLKRTNAPKTTETKAKVDTGQGNNAQGAAATPAKGRSFLRRKPAAETPPGNKTWDHVKAAVDTRWAEGQGVATGTPVMRPTAKNREHWRR